MKKLAHRFVEYVPEILEPGVLYISIEFRIVSHLCACGCGEEVVLKLSPTDWRMIFDGESISIEPSIGNWNLKCRSHYWITKSFIRWAENWTDEEIQFARKNPGGAVPDSELSVQKKKPKKRAATEGKMKESLFSLAKRKLSRPHE